MTKLQVTSIIIYYHYYELYLSVKIFSNKVLIEETLTKHKIQRKDYIKDSKLAHGYWEMRNTCATRGYVPQQRHDPQRHTTPHSPHTPRTPTPMASYNY